MDTNSTTEHARLEGRMKHTIPRIDCISSFHAGNQFLCIKLIISPWCEIHCYELNSDLERCSCEKQSVRCCVVRVENHRQLTMVVLHSVPLVNDHVFPSQLKNRCNKIL